MQHGGCPFGVYFRDLILQLQSAPWVSHRRARTHIHTCCTLVGAALVAAGWLVGAALVAAGWLVGAALVAAGWLVGAALVAAGWLVGAAPVAAESLS